MTKSLKLIGVTLLMTLAAMSFSSCDDDENGGNNEKAISEEAFLGKYFLYYEEESEFVNGKKISEGEDYDESDNQYIFVEKLEKDKYLFKSSDPDISYDDDQSEEADESGISGITAELKGLIINKEYLIGSEPDYDYNLKEDIPEEELKDWELAPDQEEDGMYRKKMADIYMYIKITSDKSFEAIERTVNTKKEPTEEYVVYYKKASK